MTKNCYGAALADIVNEGVLTKSQTGFITSMFYLVYAPLQVLGGVYADRYNPERMIKIGLVGSGLANLIIFINQNYYVMLITWMFNAVVQFSLWPSVFKIISSQLVKSDRKKGVFYISFASSAGLILGYITAAFVSKWQYNFLVSAVLLFALALVLHLIYDEIDKEYMIHDKIETDTKSETGNGKSTFKLFLVSGFFSTVVLALVKTMIEQGVKTLSPTMLMESYAQISPSIGNLLNVIIISAGIVGMLLVKLVLYPKFIKDEMTGSLIMLILALPFSLILVSVGKVNVLLVIISMSVLAALTTAMQLFSSYYNMKFKKIGREGTAAGVSNAGASLGIVIESYGFLYIAEYFSWNAVTWLWVLMFLAMTILIAITLPVWKRFKKREQL